MKGIIFTEFIEMIEAKHGIRAVNNIIDEAKLESKGIYTSVGTYPISEFQSLLIVLSRESAIEINELLYDFGIYLFHRFTILYPKFISNYTNSIELLKGIDSHIHIEVQKLYPDAELPKFDYIEEQGSLTLLYTSNRKLFAFANGLINGCINHFKEQRTVQLTQIAENKWQFKLIDNGIL